LKIERHIPPRRQPPQSGGLPRRKIFFTFLDFARADFFLKGKESFSARLRAHRAGGGATLRLGRGGIPPTPPFRRALASIRRKFSATKIKSSIRL